MNSEPSLSGIGLQEDWRRRATQWWDWYAAPFIAAYGLTLIVYSYLFTSIIFTNHTLPNVWLKAFPSHATFDEGRWFSDVINAVIGIGGSQAAQMAVACGIQIVNGFLFAALIGINRRFQIFLVAAFLSLFPAILDYYSFTSDHVAMVVGDMLALLGVLALDRLPDRKVGVGVAFLFFALSVATYQPKAALIAVLLLIWCILGALERTDLRSLIVERIVPGLSAFALALAVYYFSAKLVVVSAHATRTHINDLPASVQQVLQAYSAIWPYLGKADHFPRLLHALPLFAVLLGIAALLWRARMNGWLMFGAVLILLALFPIALRLSYIINDQTWQSSGRILTAHAYFMLFFLASAWLVPRLRAVSTAITVLMLYYFAIVGSQETNAAVMKTMFEVQKLNRIVVRVEHVVPAGKSPVPVVAIGSMDNNDFRGRRYRTYQNSLYRSQIGSDTFAPYRQVAILNFFLGRATVRPPKEHEVKAALAGAKDRQPWPAPESVYMDDGVLVLLLSPYASGVATTRTR